MGIDWIAAIPVIIPSVVALVAIIIAIVKQKDHDIYKGMGKEVSELLLSVYKGFKDRHLTKAEIQDIMEQAQDVMEEARKLADKKDD